MTGKLDMDFMLRLREALEASWDSQTSYGSLVRNNNPAFGQCYPTSRVVQRYFPQMAILEGIVCNGENEDVHFWNAVEFDFGWYHIDLTWQQFPAGSRVREFSFLDQKKIVDSSLTKRRCALLLNRVEKHLNKASEN
jgi:hypothetical protein